VFIRQAHSGHFLCVGVIVTADEIFSSLLEDRASQISSLAIPGLTPLNTYSAVNLGQTVVVKVGTKQKTCFIIQHNIKNIE